MTDIKGWNSRMSYISIFSWSCCVMALFSTLLSTLKVRIECWLLQLLYLCAIFSEKFLGCFWHVLHQNVSHIFDILFSLGKDRGNVKLGLKIGNLELQMGLLFENIWDIVLKFKLYTIFGQNYKVDVWYTKSLWYIDTLKLICTNHWICNRS